MIRGIFALAIVWLLLPTEPKLGLGGAPLLGAHMEEIRLSILRGIHRVSFDMAKHSRH